MDKLNLVTGYALSGGAKLYFETSGEGPALVFIHAGVADHRMWDPQVEPFSSRFKVVRYDLRGFGKSTMPEESFALRDDLLAVLQHLRISQAALVGCSMGGATAIDFALEHPEMVTALVPVGAGVSGMGRLVAPIDGHDEVDARSGAEGRRSRGIRVERTILIDGPGRDPSRVDPKYRERAFQLYKENFSLEFFKRSENRLTPPAIARLKEIKCPTMVVIGDSDAQDLRKVAQHLAREIPGASMTTIENAAHLPSLEHPTQFNQLLNTFLASMT